MGNRSLLSRAFAMLFLLAFHHPTEAQPGFLSPDFTTFMGVYGQERSVYFNGHHFIHDEKYALWQALSGLNSSLLLAHSSLPLPNHRHESGAGFLLYSTPANKHVYSLVGDDLSVSSGISYNFHKRQGNRNRNLHFSADHNHMGRQIDRSNTSFLDIPMKNNLLLQSKYSISNNRKNRSFTAGALLFDNHSLWGETGIGSLISGNGLPSPYRMEQDNSIASAFVAGTISLGESNKHSLSAHLSGMQAHMKATYGLLNYNRDYNRLMGRVGYGFKSGPFMSFTGGINYLVAEKYTYGYYENKEQIQSVAANLSADLTLSPKIGLKLDNTTVYRNETFYILPALFLSFTNQDNLELHFHTMVAENYVDPVATFFPFIVTSRFVPLSIQTYEEFAVSGMRMNITHESGLNAAIQYNYRHYFTRYIIDLVSMPEILWLREVDVSRDHMIEMQIGARFWDWRRDFAYVPGLVYRYDNKKAGIMGNMEDLPYYSKHNLMLTNKFRIPNYKLRFNFNISYNSAPVVPAQDISLGIGDNGFLLMDVKVIYEAKNFYNTEIRKNHRFFDRLRLLAAIENLGNYRQEDFHYNQPGSFGNSQRGALVYSPLMGRKFSVGASLRLW